MQVARELAWRQAKFGWKYEVGHLPKEANTWADALSRMAAPGGADFPTELRQAKAALAPSVKDFWKLRG